MSTGVLITGLGQYSSLGTNVGEFWASLVSMRSGLRPLALSAPYGRGLGATMSELPSDPALRLSRILDSSIREALADARISPECLNETETPVVIGTNFGDSWNISEHDDVLHSARLALSKIGDFGELWAVSTACASGIGAVGVACDLIRYEGCKKVLVCAYDVITEYNYNGLSSLRALSADTIRPFDKSRSGTLLGEGAACLILESTGASRSEAPRSYAEILGYGISNDAHHFTAPDPNGVGMRLAMTQALHESAILPSGIQYINAHGTGTVHNDRIETASIHAIFGRDAYNVPVTSTKPFIGHTMGAAGVFELMATVLSLKNGIIPPTLNHQERDPELDLDYVFDGLRQVEMQRAMSNSYGLWGCNSSVVVSRGDQS